MKPKLKTCPFCGCDDGLYVSDAPRAHPELRFSVECVCGASGAPRATEEAAIEWWDTRNP